MPKFSPITVYILLAVIVGLFYGNTLRNGFVHDDVWQVVNKAQIRSLNVGKIFGGCIAEELLGGCEGRGFYWRPMQAFFNAITYQISPSAKFFHFVNLLYFWIGASLVYLISADLWRRDSALRSSSSETRLRAYSADRNTRILTNEQRIRTNKKRIGVYAWLPLVVSVIFVAHPVNSEAVNWVSATPELLMAVFFLLSLLCYLKYLKSPKSFKLLALSAALFFLALLAKETAVFLIIVLIGADIWFHSRSEARRLSREHSGSVYWLTRISVNIRSRFKTLAIFLIPLVIYLLARSAVLGRVVYKYEGYYSLSFFEQGLTAIALLPQYLLKLVYPLPLSFQPQVAPTTLLGIGVIGGIVMIGGLGVLAWFFWVRNMRLALFGLFWILISILPALIFVNKLGEFIFAERYLLVSSIGLAIVAADVITRILTNFEHKRIFTNRLRIGTNRNVVLWGLSLFFIVWLVWGWWAVHNRSADWKDNESSYKAMIRIDHSHKKAQFQLGEIYRSTGDIVGARTQYQTALSIDPNYQEAQIALARISKQYEGSDLTFYYPEDWEIVKQKKFVTLISADKKFEAKIETAQIATSPGEYLKNQKENLGKLVNEGRALIPGFDEAWVKIWEKKISADKERMSADNLLQFFLFKDSKVVKILVSDANSMQMKVFEGVLSSIKID